MQVHHGTVTSNSPASPWRDFLCRITPRLQEQPASVSVRCHEHEAPQSLQVAGVPWAGFGTGADLSCSTTRSTLGGSGSRSGKCTASSQHASHATVRSGTRPFPGAFGRSASHAYGSVHAQYGTPAEAIAIRQRRWSMDVSGFLIAACYTRRPGGASRLDVTKVGKLRRYALGRGCTGWHWIASETRQAQLSSGSTGAVPNPRGGSTAMRWD